MSLFGKRTALPEALRSSLASDERVLAAAETQRDQTLAASRFGLWLSDGDEAVRWDWHRISKARLAEAVLHVTVADELDTWPEGTVVLADRPEAALHLTRLTKLTDVVHERVRRSVAASYHFDWPQAGGRVVLRRIPGRDGLTTQLRLDPGADPDAEGFADAVRSIRDQLWPPEVPR